MGFGERLAQADIFISIVNTRIWHAPPLADRVIIVLYGYETHVPDVARRQMRLLGTPTSKFIRFTPDFFVLDRRQPENLHLLEYKVTQTPVYSSARIASIGRSVGIQDLRWQDVGQMEADAYDTYILIASLGVRVVILNYCAYHERPLLCEYIENIRVLYRDAVTSPTPSGSGTPFVNYFAPSMRSFDAFASDEYGITIESVSYESVLTDLAAQLPIVHHVRSPLHPHNVKRRPGD